MNSNKSTLAPLSSGGEIGTSDADNQSEKFAALDMDFVNFSQVIYDDVVGGFPTALGKAVSKKERDDLKLNAATLVYGEISFDAFGIVFEKIKKKYGKPNQYHSGPTGFLQSRGGIFYDLGSGTGKPVVAAAILYNFDICCGIEILEGLHNVSHEIQQAYNVRKMGLKSQAKPRLMRDVNTEVQMIKGDILNLNGRDWRDGDIIFANSTCYDDALMADIANLAVGLKKGTFFISLTRRLPSTDFEVLEYEMHQMSWGGATVYIHQKTTDARSITPAATGTTATNEK